jgi:diguanylate cyclase (GGDEF)-like protein
VADSKSDILGLQIEALYKGAPASLLSIVGAFIALCVYWRPALEMPLAIFFFAVCAVAITHVASAAVRHAGYRDRWSPLAWSRLARGIYLLSGTFWGLGSAFMLAHGSVEQAIVACCLLMGAITVTFPAAVYVPAYNLFQIPALVFVACGLAASGMDYGIVLAAAALMLCAVMSVIGQGVGSQLALALALSEENSRLVARLEERGAALEVANAELFAQSNTDPLTGVANRRQLMSFLREVGGRCALLVVDVDHFKSYNDSFGHAEGDTCLKLIARTLEGGVIAGRDLVARQGGEEFVVVLADRSLKDAELLAEQLRASVEALEGRRKAQLRRGVTVSIGLAWRGTKRDKPIADLMQEADAAVYEAKRTGRNRVCRGGSDDAARVVA